MRVIPNPHNPSLFFLASLTLATLTIYGGGSVGNNGVQLNIGLSLKLEEMTS